MQKTRLGLMVCGGLFFRGSEAGAQPSATPPAPSSSSPSAPQLSREEPSGIGIIIRLGLGMSVLKLSEEHSTREVLGTSSGELTFDIGLRLHPAFGIGAHASLVNGLKYRQYTYDHDYIDYVVRVSPKEYGAALHAYPHDRVWISPWLGYVELGEHMGGTLLAMGISGGIDVMRLPQGHRISLYARGMQTEKYSGDDGEGIRTLSLGAAYHFH